MSNSNKLPNGVLHFIEKSNKFEFTWSKDPKTLVRHTALVLVFDDNPQLTVDFAESNPSKSKIQSVLNNMAGISQLATTSTKLSIESDLIVSPFNYDANLVILGSLLKFSINNEESKERARNLVLSILNIKMGSYNAKTNNCRTFVREAFEIIKKEPECSDIMKEKFEEEMTKIEKEDEEKIKKGKDIAYATVGVVAAGTATAAVVNKVKCDLFKKQGKETSKENEKKR